LFFVFLILNWILIEQTKFEALDLIKTHRLGSDKYKGFDHAFAQGVEGCVLIHGI